MTGVARAGLRLMWLSLTELRRVRKSARAVRRPRLPCGVSTSAGCCSAREAWPLWARGQPPRPDGLPAHAWQPLGYIRPISPISVRPSVRPRLQRGFATRRCQRSCRSSRRLSSSSIAALGAVIWRRRRPDVAWSSTRSHPSTARSGPASRTPSGSRWPASAAGSCRRAERALRREPPSHHPAVGQAGPVHRRRLRARIAAPLAARLSALPAPCLFPSRRCAPGRRSPAGQDDRFPAAFSRMGGRGLEPRTSCL